MCLAASCLAASSLSLNARAQDARAQDVPQYTDGPVTDVEYVHVEYGHFETYIDWLNSTWKPTMEAAKKAGLIVDYKVLRATPKTPDQPNIYLMITYKNMAASVGDNGDKSAEFEAVTEKVIGSLEFQNKKRVERGEYRKVLGSELVRELILK
ncbi:MAG: hypothetical protein HY243_14595 [Proteobacteria bacterium]|nr:hypothetical protein [Pseudomonadota bacterium]